MGRSKPLKLKMYQRAPDIIHEVMVTVENGWGWWNCSCGEWSHSQWDNAADLAFWAKLHESATAPR